MTICQQFDNTTIVVPCFNEEDRLDVGRYRAFADGSGVQFVLVNDGSTDGTHEVLLQLQTSDPRHFTVQNLTRNMGKAEAVRQGIMRAIQHRARFVGYWDADLATPLEVAIDFRKILVNQPVLQLVMGSRVSLLGRQIERRASRHVLGRGFATCASRILGIPVYDTQCGAKLFRVTPQMKELFSTPFCSRWIFDVEIIARMISQQQSTGQKPVDQAIYEYPLHQWRDVAGSKLKLRDFASAAWELARIRRRYLAPLPKKGCKLSGTAIDELTLGKRNSSKRARHLGTKVAGSATA